MIPKITILDNDVWVTDDVSAISLQVEYPDYDMIEHDMMYVMFESGEHSEGGVTRFEAEELVNNLVASTANQLDQLNRVDEYSIELHSLEGTREQLIDTFEALIHSLKNESASELEGPYKDDNCWGEINLL